MFIRVAEKRVISGTYTVWKLKKKYHSCDQSEQYNIYHFSSWQYINLLRSQFFLNEIFRVIFNHYAIDIWPVWKCWKKFGFLHQLSILGSLVFVHHYLALCVRRFIAKNHVSNLSQYNVRGQKMHSLSADHCKWQQKRLRRHTDISSHSLILTLKRWLFSR